MTDKITRAFDYTEYTVADDGLTILSAVKSYTGPFTTESTQLVTKTVSQYRRELRSAVRGLWNGALSLDQAFTSMDASIRSNLVVAWNEGAAKCGIKPSELSPEELTAQRVVINGELSRVFPFLLDIEDNTRAAGGKLTPLYQRTEMWVLRYSDVVNQAQVMGCADRKSRWDINVVRIVKENCPSCLKLEGKVKRNSTWFRLNLRPQNPPNPYLECGGWVCGCALTLTDEPASRGPLPKLP